MINPPTRRKFHNSWDELDYVCKKVHYLLYHKTEFELTVHDEKLYFYRYENCIKDLIVIKEL